MTVLQGEHLLHIENISHIPARVHHILSHTLTAEDTLNAHYALPSTYTIYFHLINLVCAEFFIPFHNNPLTHHPFISFSQLSSDNLGTARTGLIVHVHDTPSLLDNKLASVIQPSTPPLIIPPDSLIAHIASYTAIPGISPLRR